MTSNLSRDRWHSFLPLREFDQQLGLFFCPFAGFCRLHCCLCSMDVGYDACNFTLFDRAGLPRSLAQARCACP